MFHIVTIQSTGESLLFLASASMTNNCKTEGCHDAIKELYKRLNNTKICYIVDADIKGFFDHMKHEWIIKFPNLYIKDPNIIGLVKSTLK